MINFKNSILRDASDNNHANPTQNDYGENYLQKINY